MLQQEPNPYAPPHAMAEPVSFQTGLRILAWCSLLLPYAVLPLFMLLPYCASGIVGFILFIPAVPMSASVTIGSICAEVFQLVPTRHSFWLMGFYMVTILYEYVTLFDTIYPTFSWK
ncbi:hypothetical protein Pan97_37470 [Bremerella volcania]|uniref:Uncharacterized protein n=1 Tax=Bremerella volcania TaxID=2527984 RepID=A0A518CBT4_9BACT|nr:hypothetical protein Pan97_37470 [Bremerella volcania]